MPHAPQTDAAAEEARRALAAALRQSFAAHKQRDLQALYESVAGDADAQLQLQSGLLWDATEVVSSPRGHPRPSLLTGLLALAEGTGDRSMQLTALAVLGAATGAHGPGEAPGEAPGARRLLQVAARGLAGAAAAAVRATEADERFWHPALAIACAGVAHAAFRARFLADGATAARVLQLLRRSPRAPMVTSSAAGPALTDVARAQTAAMRLAAALAAYAPGAFGRFGHAELMGSLALRLSLLVAEYQDARDFALASAPTAATSPTSPGADVGSPTSPKSATRRLPPDATDPNSPRSKTSPRQLKQSPRQSKQSPRQSGHSPRTARGLMGASSVGSDIAHGTGPAWEPVEEMLVALVSLLQAVLASDAAAAAVDPDVARRIAQNALVVVRMLNADPAVVGGACDLLRSVLERAPGLAAELSRKALVVAFGQLTRRLTVPAHLLAFHRLVAWLCRRSDAVLHAILAMWSVAEVLRPLCGVTGWSPAQRAPAAWALLGLVQAMDPLVTSGQTGGGEEDRRALCSALCSCLDIIGGSLAQGAQGPCPNSSCHREPSTNLETASKILDTPSTTLGQPSATVDNCRQPSATLDTPTTTVNNCGQPSTTLDTGPISVDNCPQPSTTVDTSPTTVNNCEQSSTTVDTSSTKVDNCEQPSTTVDTRPTPVNNCEQSSTAVDTSSTTVDNCEQPSATADAPPTTVDNCGQPAATLDTAPTAVDNRPQPPTTLETPPTTVDDRPQPSTTVDTPSAPAPTLDPAPVMNPGSHPSQAPAPDPSPTPDGQRDSSASDGGADCGQDVLEKVLRALLDLTGLAEETCKMHVVRALPHAVLRRMQRQPLPIGPGNARLLAALLRLLALDPGRRRCLVLEGVYTETPRERHARGLYTAEEQRQCYVQCQAAVRGWCTRRAVMPWMTEQRRCRRLSCAPVCIRRCRIGVPVPVSGSVGGLRACSCMPVDVRACVHVSVRAGVVYLCLCLCSCLSPCLCLCLCVRVPPVHVRVRVRVCVCVRVRGSPDASVTASLGCWGGVSVAPPRISMVPRLQTFVCRWVPALPPCPPPHQVGSGGERAEEAPVGGRRQLHPPPPTPQPETLLCVVSPMTDSLRCWAGGLREVGGGGHGTDSRRLSTRAGWLVADRSL